MGWVSKGRQFFSVSIGFYADSMNPFSFHSILCRQTSDATLSKATHCIVLVTIWVSDILGWDKIEDCIQDGLTGTNTWTGHFRNDFTIFH